MKSWQSLSRCSVLTPGCTWGTSICRTRAARPPALRDCPISRDRKSTRLNSSHLVISYAVFCLKKKIIPLLHVHFFCLTACCGGRYLCWLFSVLLPRLPHILLLRVCALHR